MEARLNKSKYYGTINHTEEGRRHIIKHYVFGVDFIHLKAFNDFCQENNYQVHYTPMDAAKSYTNVKYLESKTKP